MKFYIKTIGFFGAVLFASSAFAQWGQSEPSNGSFGANTVSSTQGRKPLAVKLGVVVAVDRTTIEVEASETATTAGSAIGGLLGAAFAANGGSNWQTQTAVAGITALLGNQVAKRVSQEAREAQQVIVQMANGEMIAVVQETDGTPLGMGDVVFVVGASPAVRVVKAPKLASNN